MKNYLQIIRDNLSIITFVPLFIGGFLQVVFLGSIGLGYIRFFSISQVLSDGLLILGIIITFFIGNIIPRLYFDGKLEILVDTSDLIKKKRSQFHAVFLENNLVYLVSIILILFLIWLSYELYKSINITTQDNLFKILSFTLVISIVMELFASSIGTLIDRKFQFYKKISDKSSTRSILRAMLYSFLLIWIITKLLIILLDSNKADKMFYESFSFPINMNNAKNLELKGDEKIIYFNDKYIFVRSNKDGTIKVEEFNKLFSEQ